MATFEPILDPIYRGMDCTVNWSITDSVAAARDYTGATGSCVFYPDDPNDASFTKSMTLDATPSTAPQIIVAIEDTDTVNMQASQWLTAKATVTLGNGLKDIFTARLQLLRQN